jgi:hypothetical protein
MRLLEYLFESDMITYERKHFIKAKFLSFFEENIFIEYFDLLLESCVPHKDVREKLKFRRKLEPWNQLSIRMFVCLRRNITA